MTDREKERQKLIEAMAREAATYMCHDPDDWELMAGVCEAALTTIAEQGYAVVPRAVSRITTKIGIIVAPSPGGPIELDVSSSATNDLQIKWGKGGHLGVVILVRPVVGAGSP